MQSSLPHTDSVATKSCRLYFQVVATAQCIPIVLLCWRGGWGQNDVKWLYWISSVRNNDNTEHWNQLLIKLIMPNSMYYTARYLDMHCSNSSQTLLQHFDDAVITFIRWSQENRHTLFLKLFTYLIELHNWWWLHHIFLAWWRWSQHHWNVAIKFVQCMSEYRAGVEQPLLLWLSSHTNSMYIVAECRRNRLAI